MRVLLTALDPRTAAYASSTIVQGVIRRELGFTGTKSPIRWRGYFSPAIVDLE
jgi:hypothetical protein